MGFYGSNYPTNSVKALKEVVVLRIGFNPTRSTSPCCKPTQYTCMQYIHKNQSKHSEMGPVRQNPIQRTVRSVHMCVHCTVHNCFAHNIARNRPDNFPLTLQTITIAPMMSTWGKGEVAQKKSYNRNVAQFDLWCISIKSESTKNFFLSSTGTVFHHQPLICWQVYVLAVTAEWSPYSVNWLLHK